MPVGDVKPNAAMRASRSTWNSAIEPLTAESLPPVVARFWSSNTESVCMMMMKTMIASTTPTISSISEKPRAWRSIASVGCQRRRGHVLPIGALARAGAT